MQISKTNLSRFSDFICPAILLLIAIAIAYPRWRAGIDWRDEGLLAYGAERVVHGEIPHRDFVSLRPPASSAFRMFTLFRWRHGRELQSPSPPSFSLSLRCDHSDHGSPCLPGH